MGCTEVPVNPYEELPKQLRNLIFVLPPDDKRRQNLIQAVDKAKQVNRFRSILKEYNEKPSLEGLQLLKDSNEIHHSPNLPEILEIARGVSILPAKIKSPWENISKVVKKKRVLQSRKRETQAERMFNQVSQEISDILLIITIGTLECLPMHRKMRRFIENKVFHISKTEALSARHMLLCG